VNRPAALGGSPSAKAVMSPRAISSSCACMVTATPSRSWSMPASLPVASALLAGPADSGTLSM